LASNSKNVITLGVIADTHVPDRRRRLDARILPILRSEGVQAILHAGDVSSPEVLTDIENVAPIYAVRGNRDWFLLRHLPKDLVLEFNTVKIGLTHGHGGWINYLKDRPDFFLHGYYHDRLLPRLRAQFPRANVIVFGHGHLPLNRWIDGQLFFNPGSPHFSARRDVLPSLGFLRIKPGGEVCGEIVFLD
jgi:putative phosphoesterase